jgi:hypothetical protein
MRCGVVVLLAVTLLGLPLLPWSSSAESATEKDSWVGSYVEYDAEKGRPVPDPPMTITKIGDDYVVSSLKGYRFKEVGKGTLADKKNAVDISIVSVRSADGGRTTVLLVSSCYGPNFHLIRKIRDEQ